MFLIVNIIISSKGFEHGFFYLIVTQFILKINCCNFLEVKNNFTPLLLGMVKSTQGIILLGKMRRHVTFGNVYCGFH